MATKKKMLQAAAGNAGGAGLNVEEVFSTYLYDGTDGTQSIVNGVDLSNEGGLVWVKNRGFTVGGTTGITDSHQLFDTERGVGTRLLSNTTSAALSATNYFSSFNSDGFTVGQNINNGFDGGHRYTSWTFRKAPKFFDVVTYTGTGSAQTIAHNLGCDVGCIIIKRTDTTGNWQVGFPEQGSLDWIYGILDLTNSMPNVSYGSVFLGSKPTGDSIDLIGDNTGWNASGGSYVMYLFAHNDGDGEFGPDGDADIIKCGSYTGNGSTNGPEIDLGFEPQWVMIKSSSNADNWNMYDNMRGVTGSSSDPRLLADQTNAELTGFEGPQFNATGFKMVGTAISNGSGRDYIYIAIRRGTKVPESGTEVFTPDFNYNTDTNYQAYLGAPADMWMFKTKNTPSDWFNRARLTGGDYRNPNLTNADTSSTFQPWDNNEGYYKNAGTPNTNGINYLWKRAPNFFDVVAYTGDGVAGRTVSHNLGVAPEMMWVKSRVNTGHWLVYNNNLNGGTNPEDYALLVNDISAQIGPNAVYWNSTAPSSTDFTVGTNSNVNTSGNTYIAYLFASLDGVSKLFSVTKSSGSDASVNCGFSSGPRFVMLKRTDSTGDWYVWDTERGIIAGNDPYMILNDGVVEVTSTDYIDPTSNGFTIVNGGLADGDYIGYAVA